MARIPPEAVATARTAASATKYHDGHRSASGNAAETAIHAAPNQHTLTRGAIRDLEPTTYAPASAQIAVTPRGMPAISSQLSVPGVVCPPSDTADQRRMARLWVEPRVDITYGVIFVCDGWRTSYGTEATGVDSGRPG